MANTPTILVTVTPEPPSYHDTKDDKTRVYTVHLAFGGEKNDVLRLLNSKTWSFTAYGTDGKKAANITTEAVASQQLIEDRGQRLFAWLKKGSVFDGSATTPGGTVELDGTSSPKAPKPNVRDVLHGSIAWDAPIPQDLGLTYLVQCKLATGAAWPDSLLILPVSDEALTINNGQADSVTVTSAGQIAATCVATYVHEAAQLPPPVLEGGFLECTFSPDEYRLLERLESKGASLIWMLPAFTGFVSEKQREHETNHTEATPDALQKYARIACCVALDPLLLAIGPPTAKAASTAGRTGMLLGPLASEIDNKLRLSASHDAESRKERVRHYIDLVRTEIENVAKDATTNADEMRAIGVPPEIADSLLPSPRSLPELLAALNALMAHFQQEAGIEMALHASIERFLLTLSKSHAPQPERDAVSNACRAYLDSLDKGINAADTARSEIGHRVLTEVLQPGTTPNDALKQKAAYFSRLKTPPLAPCLPLAAADLLEDLTASLEARWKVAIKDFAIQYIAPAEQAQARKRFQPDSVPQPLPISISTTAAATQLDDFTQRFNGIGVVIRSSDRDAGGWSHANLAEFRPWLASPPEKDSPYDSETVRVGVRTLLPIAVDGRREMFLRYRGFPLSSEAYRDTMRDAGGGGSASAPRQSFYESHDLDYVAKGYARVPRLAYGKTYDWVAYAVTKGGSLPFILQKGNIRDASPTPWLPKVNLEDFKPPNKDVVGSEAYRRRTAVGATTIVDAPGQAPRIGIRYPEVYPLSIDNPRLCLVSVSNTTKNAEHQAHHFIDLFRNADGSGQLKTTTTDTWRIRLDDLLLTKGDPESSIKVIAELKCYGANDDWVVPPAEMPVMSGAHSVKITLPSPPAPPADPGGDGSPAPTQTVSHDCWLRLHLKANRGSASLAFNPPSVSRSSTGPASENGIGDPLPCHADTPPVLLIGASPCWSPAFSKRAQAQVVLPRTTWLDWEHWCGNTTLQMYGQARHKDPQRDVFLAADGHLLTASVLRSLDDDINRLLDRLPDPSVSAVIAELTVIDRHVPAAATAPAPVGQVVIDYSSFTRDVFGDNDDPSKSPGIFASLRSISDPADYGENLRRKLDEVDRRFRISVQIEATPQIDANSKLEFRQGQLSGTIPEGTIARLTIRPFVPWPKEDHPAFDRRMKDLAVGTATVGGVTGLVFEGASVTIEAMFDLPKAKDKSQREEASREQKRFLKHVEIAPIHHVRDYRVLFVPEPADAVMAAGGNSAGETTRGPGDPWRLFSHVEMRTQRWRFSGRPIYGWINPKDYRKATTQAGTTTTTNGSPPTPAIELEGYEIVKAFESELFFDRDDADCEFTRVRLTGGRDELLSCPWELPSATYFRHAFNFVSRYAGAMQPGKGTPLWPPRQADWSHRVAMLADAPRLEVTRPQMRCIVPLTTSPDATEPVTAAPDIEQRKIAPTAPVACILEERPFAVGGLAERMLGEIVTGVGYGFDGKDLRVQPLDFAKETSRDGRLSAWGWTPPTGFSDQPSPARSFIVETEGPIGLHFEETLTPAPAWSNCQYLLRPRSLRDRQPLPEESFLGVQLRRFLDPEWIFDPNPTLAEPPSNRWPLQAPCIVRHTLPLNGARGPLARVTLGNPGSEVSLIEFDTNNDNQALVISANRSLLGANYLTGSLPLCEIPLPTSGVTGDLALLHMPHGDGSSTISIALVPAEEDAADGRANAPLIVGTARWTLAHLSSQPAPATSTSDTKPAAGEPTVAALDFPLVGEKAPVVHATAMSQPTYREWTRTAKNADFITAMIGDGKDQPIRVGGIRAKVVPKREDKEPRLEFRLSPGPEPDVPADKRNALWLCGSLANSRMPLFVHRYLVGVYTSASSRGNRTYQSFAHASFLGDGRPRLPVATVKQIDFLTLHEMEVPAKIVVGGEGLPASLDQFKTATIDLQATGGLPTPGQTVAYRLHVRFANSKASMSKTGAKLRLTFSITTKQAVTDIDVPQNIHSLIAMWTSANAAPTVRFVYWDGKFIDANPASNPDPSPSLSNPADHINIQIIFISPPATELWADVSLLHRPAEKDWSVTSEAFDNFTFDWLFSSRDAGDDRSPASRTSSSTLAARVEAQGRFISSSQPIAIDPS